MSSPAALLITPETVAALNPSLLHFALRIVRRREDAEDLVQETWFSALRSAPTFEGRSSLKVWLTGILRRRIADRFSRQRPTYALEEEQHESPDAPPGEQHAWDEAARFVHEALAALPLLERQAITLCDIEGGDRDEVARRLGVTRGHLRVLLHRAHTKLAVTLRRRGFDLEVPDVD